MNPEPPICTGPARTCVVKKEFPKQWKEMVYVLLKKKHGDQRKMRKMREIALMDQTLKLMLKCVKRLSFDRMVGRTRLIQLKKEEAYHIIPIPLVRKESIKTQIPVSYR